MLVVTREEVDCGVTANIEHVAIKRRDKYVKRPSVRAMEAVRKPKRDTGRSM